MMRDNVSKLHRLKVDEAWHFYHGSSVNIVELDSSVPGHARITRLGSVEVGLCPKLSCLFQEHQKGDRFQSRGPQYTVKAGTWFGAFPEGAFALVGCTCGPAFEFEHFELAEGPALLDAYPEAEQFIRRLL
eukprot:symbB.v1.2.028646.t1/scaffold3053.1/size64650/5